MKIKNSFWGSWFGIGFGIFFILIGLTEIDQDLTTLDAGFTILFASLAYRSIKQRRLQAAPFSYWRIGGEALAMAYVSMNLAIDMNTPKYVYDNPMVLFIPAFGIVAYLVAYFAKPIDTQKEVKHPTKADKASNTKSKYQGIGGWLTLVALGLLVTPVMLAFHLLGTYLPLLTEGTLQALSDPSSEAYHPLWVPLITFEVVGNILMFLGYCYLLYIFFKRSETFPKSYIFLTVASLIFIAIDFFAADLIPAVAEQDDSEMLEQLIRAAIGCAIWVPYMLKSERVKATFVEPYSDRIYTFFSSILSRFGNANT